MGGGNGQKSFTARAKAQAKMDAAGQASSADTRKTQAAANTAIQCSICMQTFGKTTKQPELQQHIDSKHAKAGKSLAECFPGFTA